MTGGALAKRRLLRKLIGEMETPHSFKTMSTPVGELKLVAGANGLAAVLWEDDSPRRVPLGMMTEDRHHPLLLETERQLNGYFTGRRKEFSLPLDFRGTAFQKAVWHALLTIPYGETRSYSEIAIRIGNPKSARAVGAANGRNPISIIAPCHRVIGSNGTLTGFAGGLEAKFHLLKIEGTHGASARSDWLDAAPENSPSGDRVPV